MLLSDELHRTVLVRSWVLPSLNVPVAVNCCCEPSAMLGLAGETCMETSVGGGVFMPELQPHKPNDTNTKAIRMTGMRNGIEFA